MSKAIESVMFAVTLVTASASTIAQSSYGTATQRLGIPTTPRDYGVSAPRPINVPPPVYNAPALVPRAPVFAAPVYTPPPPAPARAPVIAPLVVPGLAGGMQPGVGVGTKTASGFISGPEINPANVQQPIVPAARIGVVIPGDAPPVPRDPTKADPSAPPALGSAGAPRP